MFYPRFLNTEDVSIIRGEVAADGRHLDTGGSMEAADLNRKRHRCRASHRHPEMAVRTSTAWHHEQTTMEDLEKDSTNPKLRSSITIKDRRKI